MILRIYFQESTEPELMLFDKDSDLELACFLLDKLNIRWEFVNLF